MTTHPIPEHALDSDIAIVGRKGGGKSYTAKGIVERLLTAGRRVLVLDPLGIWAGLRTGADGKTPGFPVAIFGGPHGDMPLDTAAAVPMADILARENVPAVIDLADLSKTAQQSFLLAFLAELRRVNTEALTIVLEEADVFAPQQPMGDDSKMLHSEIDWIARRGRFRGFRLITITQRPARLSKDVLTQCGTLVAHRLPAPQDREAIKAWVDGNGDRDEAKKVFDTLAQLQTGEAWIWVSDDGTLKRERFPKITTLDTSATPKAGERKIVPKTLAEVDLSKIKTAMAEATKDKPVKIAGERKASAAELQEAENRGYERGIRAAAAHISEFSLSWTAPEGRKSASFETADRHPVGKAFADAILDLVGKRVPEASGYIETALARPIKSGPLPPQRPPAHVNGHAPKGDLPPAKQMILDALAWLESIGQSTPARNVVAFVGGISSKSSAYANNVSALRTGGLIDYPGDGLLVLTPQGRGLASRPDRKLDHGAMMQALSGKLVPAQMRILVAATKAYPKALTRDGLAAAAGASALSSAFANNVSRLSSLGLVTYPANGQVRGADLLFP